MKDELEMVKEDNARNQARLREDEMETHHIGDKLGQTNAAKKNQELEADHLQNDLGHKLR